MQLPDFMAKACYYAQEHVDDKDAWDDNQRECYFTCVSYQMACFFAQNTVYGEDGVDSCIILDDLVGCPMKTEKKWLNIINKIAETLGGWKKS